VGRRRDARCMGRCGIWQQAILPSDASALVGRCPGDRGIEAHRHLKEVQRSEETIPFQHNYQAIHYRDGVGTAGPTTAEHFSQGPTPRGFVRSKPSAKGKRPNDRLDSTCKPPQCGRHSGHLLEFSGVRQSTAWDVALAAGLPCLGLS
jgi:hypothetical protein